MSGHTTSSRAGRTTGGSSARSTSSTSSAGSAWPSGSTESSARQMSSMSWRTSSFSEGCPATSGPTTAPSSSRQRCGTGSPPWAPKPPSSSPAHLGRMAVARASTPSSGTSSSTARSSTACARLRSSSRAGDGTTTPGARTHPWAIVLRPRRSSSGRLRHPEPLRRPPQP